MSAMSDVAIELMEAGVVPVEMAEVREWRAAGHAVPIMRVPVAGGRARWLAISMETAERLASNLDDEASRLALAGAVADIRAYRQPAGCEIASWLRGRAIHCRETAVRLAAEIVAAVSRGDEMPEEWFVRDTYADAGEPESEEIVRLVREELMTTGIRV